MTYISIIGYVAAFCTTFAGLPQMIKTIRTKRTADISFSMYLLVTVGIFLWLIYGIMIKDYPLIAANSVSLIFSAVIFIYKIRYK